MPVTAGATLRGSESATTAIRRLSLPTMLVVMTVALSAWIVGRSYIPPGMVYDWASMIAATLPATFAGLLCLSVGRRSVDAAARGWTLIGAGCLAGGIATMASFAAQLQFGMPEVAAAVWGVGHLMLLACLLGGLFSWLGGQAYSVSAATVIDLLTMGLLAYAIIWNTSLRGVLDSSSQLGTSTGDLTLYAMPFFDLFVLAAAIALLGQLGRRHTAGALVLGTLGIMAMLGSDMYFAYAVSQAGSTTEALFNTYGVGTRAGLIDLGWLCGLGGVALAAAVASRSSERRQHRVPLIERSMAGEAVLALLPFVMLAGTIVVWDRFARQDPVTLAAAYALAGLLIVRCGLTALQSTRASHQAITDQLTGTFNHRHFQESLQVLTRRAAASGKPLSLAIVDIDEFGTLNDAFGHAKGDLLLRETAYVLRSCARADDLVFRIGADEFALLLPDTSSDGAEQLAGRISGMFDELITRNAGIDPSLTVGIASIPRHTDDVHELVRLAEGTLYWCKLTGKRQIAAYDAEVVEVLSADERLHLVEQNAQLRVILALAKALDARDAYTATHSHTVARYAVAIAYELQWDHEQAELLRIAGLLHDVGKIGVRDSTLHKAGKLDNDEWQEMRLHPELSARMITGVAPDVVIPWVLAHHERMDGRGYPHGLAGDDIPLAARILAVADSFDAMTSSRSYRAGMPLEFALNELVTCAGAQFDPFVVRAALEAVQRGTMLPAANASEGWIAQGAQAASDPSVPMIAADLAPGHDFDDLDDFADAA